MIKIEVPYLKADDSVADPEHIAALHAHEQLLRGVLSVDGKSYVPKRKKPGPTAQFEYDPQEILMAEKFLQLDAGERFGRLVERMRGEFAVPMPCNADAPNAKDDGAGGWTVELFNENHAVMMAKFATPAFADAVRDKQAQAFDASREELADYVSPIAGREGDGMMLGGSHGDPTNFVTGMQMIGLDCTGIDPVNTYDAPAVAVKPAKGALVFVEEIPSVFQPHLDKFMRKGKMPPVLDSFLGTLGTNYHKDYHAMLANVRESGGRVVGLDDTSSKIFDASLMSLDDYHERRAGIMNVMSADIMGEALGAADAGTKFIALVGAAHVEEHAGGVLGMSQMLGVDYACYDDGELALAADGSVRVSRPEVVDRFRPQDRAPTPAPVPKKTISEKARNFASKYLRR